jgi:nicotinate-nucleotide adenylyltransferase
VSREGDGSSGPRPLEGDGPLGVFGGAFDPIHVGHLAIAEEARETLGLRGVLFVPTGSPPHRPSAVAPAEQRFAMTAAAVAGNPAFVTSRMELDRAGPSYTSDTLAALAAEDRAAGRGSGLVLILSAETFRDLPGWHEPRRILELARVAVAPRLGHDTPSRAWLEERFPGLGERVTFLEQPRLEVSSTAIRARLAAGRSIRYLVPDAVIARIVEHALYSDRGRPRAGHPATGG